MAEEIDLRAALNAVSDVIQNRPRPLREFDQIYMKAGDMVMQSEFIARWADGKHLAFIGDGDAISVCVVYLQARGILPYGPAHVTVFDFDERICNAVTRFADQERLENLDARLYNCLDAFPACSQFDAFYSNPPWGASNDGESVNVFMQRGMEAVGFSGDGAVVVADDPTLEWPSRVLANLQRAALDAGFYVQRMMTQVHSYHLDVHTGAQIRRPRPLCVRFAQSAPSPAPVSPCRTNAETRLTPDAQDGQLRSATVATTASPCPASKRNRAGWNELAPACQTQPGSQAASRGQPDPTVL